MIDAIGLTAISLQQDMQRMSVIANNAANVMTTGFKREYLMTASEVDPNFIANGLTEPSISTTPMLNVMTDTKSGLARQTGNVFDLALQGEGYFEVLTDTNWAYTRQGNFHLDERGRLVTQAGFPVSGVGGDVVIKSATPVIDKEGRIFEQGKQVAQIKVVSFESNRALTNVGGGMSIQADNSEKSEVKKPQMLQGNLESSNVDSAFEMVKMLETFRHFETSNRVIQAYDDLSDKALRNLGQF